MEKYVSGEQVKISFKDGSQVTAEVISQDKNNLKCSALSKNEVYKEGDIIFVDKKTDMIEKINMKKKSGNPNDNQFNSVRVVLDAYEWNTNNIQNKMKEFGVVWDDYDESVHGDYYELDMNIKTYKKCKSWFDEDAIEVEHHFDNYSLKKKSKRFNWEFDKHQPQWRINKESKEIEKDEDAINKVGRLKNKLAKDKYLFYVVILADDNGTEKDRKIFKEFNKEEIETAFHDFINKAEEGDEIEYYKSDKQSPYNVMLTVVIRNGKPKREVIKGSKVYYVDYNGLNKQSHTLDKDSENLYSMAIAEMKEQFNQYLITDDANYLDDCITNCEWLAIRLKEEMNNHDSERDDIVDIPRNYENGELPEYLEYNEPAGDE